MGDVGVMPITSAQRSGVCATVFRKSMTRKKNRSPGTCVCLDFSTDEDRDIEELDKSSE